MREKVERVRFVGKLLRRVLAVALADKPLRNVLFAVGRIQGNEKPLGISPRGYFLQGRGPRSFFIYIFLLRF